MALALPIVSSSSRTGVPVAGCVDVASCGLRGSLVYELLGRKPFLGGNSSTCSSFRINQHSVVSMDYRRLFQCFFTTISPPMLIVLQSETRGTVLQCAHLAVTGK